MFHRLGTFAAATVVASVVLAGCFGDEDPLGTRGRDAGGDTQDAPTASDEAGLVQGQVTDEELRPLAGAEVSLIDLADNVTTKTAADGTFHIRDVPPGAHVLAAQKIGYESVSLAVDVAAAETTFVEVTLKVLAIVVPYVEVIPYEGFDSCSYALFGFVGSAPDPCPLGMPENEFALNLTDSWRYFVAETVWLTQDSFWVSIQDEGEGCTTGNPCQGVEISGSPNRIEGAPQNPALAARYSLDGERMYEEGRQNLSVFVLYAGMLREEINTTAPGVCTTFWGQFGVAARLGCPLGVGYSTGIRFQHYHSIFHWEPPADPSTYSAIPA